MTYTAPTKIINNDKFCEESFETKPGDTVFIDINVVHRAGFNCGQDIVKFSVQRCYHYLKHKKILDKNNAY